MKIGITKLIAENIAPSNASKLAVFDGDTKVGTVDISKMQPSNLGEKLYSFGVTADIHVTGNNSTAGARFDKALTFLESQGAIYCCVAGDLTTIGFWMPISETDGTSYYYPDQFEELRSIIQKHKNIIVLLCTGNHESYNNYSITQTYTDIYGADTTLVVNNLEKYKEYTGYDISFSVEHGDDVFVFVGQPHGSKPMSDEDLQWLYETLEANRNKRCFVFIHPYISEKDSGQPLGLHKIPIFNYWGTTKTTAFTNMMKHYKNTMLFHGHSHVRPEVQEIVKNVNYSTALSFRSVSVPSTANSRTIIDGALVSDDSSFCYLVDVYKSCVVMRAYNLLEDEFVPIGQYCIDTTLVYVEANTFTDSTGTITT